MVGMTAPPQSASLAVENLLDTLSPRQRRIVQLRFGLVDGHERTPEEVARRLGVPAERIQRVEAEALRSLSDPSRSLWVAPVREHARARGDAAG